MGSIGSCQGFCMACKKFLHTAARRVSSSVLLYPWTPDSIKNVLVQEFGDFWTDMLANDQQLPWDAKTVMHLVEKAEFR